MDTHRRARIIVPDNPPPAPICVECHKPITVLIVATTPRNPRRHIVAVPAAYTRTTAGPVCPDCWDKRQPEHDLVADVAATYARILDPVVLPADTPPALLRVYTHMGKVVRTERVLSPAQPSTLPPQDAEGVTATADNRQNGSHR